MIDRKIRAELADSSKSILLLGPRQAGKSTLMQSLNPDLMINLADEDEYFSFSSNPGELRSRIDSERENQSKFSIFIDEIQRLPSLLNTIQALIDERRGLKFYLTGSSARKLKRGGANLLPGRVLFHHLGPFASLELGYRADTERLLTLGALPEPYLEKSARSAQRHLQSYVSGYVKEEIRSEALVRNLEAFTRFIPVAVGAAGHFLDYSKLAKSARVSRHSLSRFFEIFEDTLVGQRVWPFPAGLERADLVKHPKFYLFDNGVYNAVLGNFAASPDRRGVLAEQLIFNQLLHSAAAMGRSIRVSTFRTRGGLEVDFVVELDGELHAIEVKGAEQVHNHETTGLIQFKKLFPECRSTSIFHLGSRASKLGAAWALPWQEGLKKLGL